MKMKLHWEISLAVSKRCVCLLNVILSKGLMKGSGKVIWKVPRAILLKLRRLKLSPGTEDAVSKGIVVIG